MPTTKSLYRRQSGHMGQYETWWSVIVHEDGTHEIEHEWDDVKVGSGEHSAGSRTYPLEEGLRRAPSRAREEYERMFGKPDSSS